ncbi:amidohydrolase [Pasteuria penetrans]|uniref:amidohydrolase n=1 Tax=Pasteuria penetrans TaxID=86005 RepID=UPI000FABA093|nr:amidohydrolase [Pasteuria penetrans]
MHPCIVLRRKLHQIPEISFQEHDTQKAILSFLSDLPQQRLTIHHWRTGLFVHLQGTEGQRRWGYRADIDGLPIQEKTNLPFSSQRDGYMHACGHDFHIAIACGLIAAFVEKPIRDHLLVLFQPAEEEGAGALQMRESEFLSSLPPEAIFALHIAPQYPVGTIATRPGTLFAATQPFAIQLRGNSSHASEPHRGNDMVVAAASLILQLQTILSRNIPPGDTATLCLGQLRAGQSRNVIAETASLLGTIRSLSPSTMEHIQQRIQHLVGGIKHGFSCHAHLDWGTPYASVNNDPTWYTAFKQFVQDKTPYSFLPCGPTLAGEDFGFLLQKKRGLMFWLGVDSPYPLHHPALNPKEEAIPLGIALLKDFFCWLGDTSGNGENRKIVPPTIPT